ncbi:hypothetical protein B5M09_013655 [Aphanomyces astaci]|uniref:26S proteasome regulatory subunit Rpn7 N-terminal domain-containing protein n=1 Tax=Aphanomyces astaci TaxID=112090 RepID=A0A425DNG1_APHAT|nr:hypothetical protein B5M09_013655 [Aphanomyces astaci]
MLSHFGRILRQKEASISMGATEEATKKKPTSGHISEQLEEDISTFPHMEVSHLYFLLQVATPSHAALADVEVAAAKTKLLGLIAEHHMAPFYERVAAEFHWPVDTALLATMKYFHPPQQTQHNEDELTKLDAQLADAEANLGDIEVLEAHLGRARLYSLIGDKDKVLEAFHTALAKPTSVNQKIIIQLHIIRVGLFFSDLPLVETHIKKARVLIDEGGDWDRRNRLKVYEGCYLLMARDFKKASSLFQVLIIRLFFTFFSTFLVGLHAHVNRDKYLALHSRYIYRELRILAYAQFLEAYRR